MLSELLLLGLVLALVWFWLDSARAREIANELAMIVCQREGVQFLDGTVALRRLGPCRTTGGIRAMRVFTFDYSDDAVERCQGYIRMCGKEMTNFSFGERPAE